MKLKVISEFTASECAQWFPINDAVMGGCSRGSLSCESDSVGAFTGYVSFENNGGFASIRSIERNYEISGSLSVRLLVMGDGKIYKFRIGTTDLADGCFFEHAFEPARAIWSIVRLKFSDFYVTRRGKRIENPPPFNPDNTISLGFLISDRQEGAFQLLIDRLEVEFD